MQRSSQLSEPSHLGKNVYEHQQRTMPVVTELIILIFIIRRSTKISIKNQFPIFCSDCRGYYRSVSNFCACCNDHQQHHHDHREDKDHCAIVHHFQQQRFEPQLVGVRIVIAYPSHRLEAHLQQVRKGDWCEGRHQYENSWA